MIRIYHCALVLLLLCTTVSKITCEESTPFWKVLMGGRSNQNAQDEKGESVSAAGFWHNVLPGNINPPPSKDVSNVFQAYTTVSKPKDEAHQFMFPGGPGVQQQGGFIQPGSFQQGPFVPNMPFPGQPNMPNVPLPGQPNLPNTGQPTFPNQLFPQVVGPIDQNNRFPIFPIFPRPQPIVVGPQPSFMPPVYPTAPPPTYQPPRPTYRPPPTYQPPVPTYRPSPTYQPPRQTYRPPPTYQPPRPTYRPPPTYQPPRPTYRPPPTYQPPRPTYRPPPAPPTYRPPNPNTNPFISSLIENSVYRPDGNRNPLAPNAFETAIAQAGGYPNGMPPRPPPPFIQGPNNFPQPGDRNEILNLNFPHWTSAIIAAGYVDRGIQNNQFAATSTFAPVPTFTTAAPTRPQSPPPPTTARPRPPTTTRLPPTPPPVQTTSQPVSTTAPTSPPTLPTPPPTPSTPPPPVVQRSPILGQYYIREGNEFRVTNNQGVPLGNPDGKPVYIFISPQTGQEILYIKQINPDGTITNVPIDPGTGQPPTTTVATTTMSPTTTTATTTPSTTPTTTQTTTSTATTPSTTSSATTSRTATDPSTTTTSATTSTGSTTSSATTITSSTATTTSSPTTSTTSTSATTQPQITQRFLAADDPNNPLGIPVILGFQNNQLLGVLAATSDSTADNFAFRRCNNENSPVFVEPPTADNTQPQYYIITTDSQKLSSTAANYPSDCPK